ncbi:MAG: NAD-dependent epimerase/dehydratase family protein [Candidatus Dadabacteria bacterium]|nr:MAG: NAD-dependent epimerase/dehydratase family protein [Candidatus Dadabacteria bacterium]
MADTVLVTGSTGHLGYNLVRELVRAGYRVRAGVRDPGDRERTAPLRELDVEIVPAPIEDEDRLYAAARGADGFFHLAALTKMWARDPESEVIRPNVRGVENALRAAKRAGVRRVVMTSSVMAMGSLAPPDRPLTEADWNDDREATHYGLAKTRAERRAWELASELGVDLVTINPSSMIGPGYFRHTPMTWLVELMVRGYVRCVLPATPAWVDVRDAATAHRLAYEIPEASGRYLVSAVSMSFGDMVNRMHELDGRIPRVRWPVPLAVLRVFAGLDLLLHLLTGAERRLTGAILDQFFGGEMHCSSEKARRELGWQARPFDQTLADTIEWVRSRRGPWWR